MKIIPAVVAAILATSAIPVAGQDFLGSFENFVETLTSPPEQRPRAAPKEVERPVTPPVPRPRPPGLPDEPVVEAPKPPIEAPEVAKAEPVAEPASEPVAERVYQVACPAVLLGLVEAEMVKPLSEGACGEQSPLLVTGVMSRGRMVPLSTPITTNCQLASALPDWVETVDTYAEAVLGSALAEVGTGTSYICRNRNNAKGGFTSEHGFANAVDVSGFTLADGRSIGVEADWLPAMASEGRLLRLAHDAGCTGFTTVLGPEANAEHEDHLHLDLGCHGAGCTARVCE